MTISSEESREFCRMRGGQEAAEAFKAGKMQPSRRYWVEPNRIEERDPRDRD